MATRQERLMPGGVPRYVRCWDDGCETIDRYTVAFTGRGHGGRWGLAMSARPFHPQGFFQHWETSGPVSGMGKRITFSELPADCQKAVVSEYKEVWAIE